VWVASPRLRPIFQSVPERDEPSDCLKWALRPPSTRACHCSSGINGFQEDWNVVFPLDRLNELAGEGAIGSVATTHYSFMGAANPLEMVDGAKEIAGKLKADHVDAVLLTSV